MDLITPHLPRGECNKLLSRAPTSLCAATTTKNFLHDWRSLQPHQAAQGPMAPNLFSSCPPPDLEEETLGPGLCSPGAGPCSCSFAFLSSLCSLIFLFLSACPCLFLRLFRCLLSCSCCRWDWRSSLVDPHSCPWQTWPFAWHLLASCSMGSLTSSETCPRLNPLQGSDFLISPAVMQEESLETKLGTIRSAADSWELASGSHQALHSLPLSPSAESLVILPLEGSLASLLLFSWHPL